MTVNTTFENRVAQLLADPLSIARAAAHSGQRVIGYVGAEAPVELVLAANALPVRLRGQPGAPTPRADEFFESAFVPEIRAVAELWLNGQLDFLEAVVFPRTNDSAQRLYYYVCEFQRRGICSGPKPLLFDIATIARDTSVAHTLASTKQLATMLGADLAKLPAAIERVARRSVHAPASKGFRARRAAELDWTEQFDSEFATFVRSTAPSVDKTYILAGSSPPDERLHIAVEQAGGIIVRDFTDTVSAAASGGDALSAIAQRYHHTSTPAQRMLQSNSWLMDEVQAINAAGAIFWLIEEDEALPWEVAGQVNALQSAGIPVLSLTRQRWLVEAETLQAIGEFVRNAERQS